MKQATVVPFRNFFLTLMQVWEYKISFPLHSAIALDSVVISLGVTEGNSEKMSAAQAVLVESAPYLESVTKVSPPDDDVVRELIHDLRQPLSSIEAIAYYLEMTLPPEQTQARLYMRRVQQLVDQTSSILTRAAADISKEVIGLA